MDRQKRNLIIAVVLIVGMVAILSYRLTQPVVPKGVEVQPAATPAGETAKSASAGGETVKPAAGVKEPVDIDIDAILASLERGRFVYDYTTLRDPMTPVIYGSGGEGPEQSVAVSRAHVLDGIIWSSDEPLACIDGNVVGTGEKLADGAVVESILPDKVVLRTDTGMFSVGFYEE